MPGSRLSRSHLVKTDTKMDQELLKVIARAPEILKRLPKEHLELLRDKLSHLGCTVALATKLKGPELVTVLLAATTISDI